MRLLRDLFKDFRFTLSFIVLVVILSLAVLSLFSPYDPTLWYVVPRDLPPSATYLLGTDSNGQDIFWQATFAVRNSLVVSLISGLLSRTIAILIGMVAGYKGGTLDRVLMFVGDSLLVIPLVLIFVMLAMMVRQNMTLVTLGLMLAGFGWAWDARLIRSMVLSLREREFTKTAVLSGTGTIKLVLKEYMPFTMPLVFSTLINNMSWAIGIEMFLAILGLVNLNIPTLGTMLNWALHYQSILLGRWWWVLTPVLLSLFVFIALYWMSVSVSEYLDPRTRIQRVGA
ncbi:MAG: ABC transporter permease [Anaerolineae bacterium]|uniref:ABC transporter permease n=1 Tax=Candidatus Flexifilum breve TaxID=3140694 RepID=UPI001AD59E11|nr:ABC transporter permease [Chloroflexota bacterium]MBN8636367.1 ABC transporter permease [Anaerolineae bacterium]